MQPASDAARKRRPRYRLACGSPMANPPFNAVGLYYCGDAPPVLPEERALATAGPGRRQSCPSRIPTCVDLGPDSGPGGFFSRRRNRTCDSRRRGAGRQRRSPALPYQPARLIRSVRDAILIFNVSPVPVGNGGRLASIEALGNSIHVIYVAATQTLDFVPARQLGRPSTPRCHDDRVRSQRGRSGASQPGGPGPRRDLV